MSQPEQQQKTTVGEYLLARLTELGVGHIFGVPGDFILHFFDQITKSKIKYVGTCNELNAAYAADGYARIKGIGALATTHSVGELSALNGVAGSYVEQVPVVAITGLQGTWEKNNPHPLLHHSLSSYGVAKEIYEKVTVAHTVLNDPERVPHEVDRVLIECISRKRPVYIGLPCDMVTAPCDLPRGKLQMRITKTEHDILKECIEEVKQKIETSEKVIIVAGFQLVRYQLQQELNELLAKTGIPFVTMMMGKSILGEDHPQFIGLYQGGRSREYTKQMVEQADCVLLLGELLTDLNTGGFSANLDKSKVVTANLDSVQVGNHIYPSIFIGEFIKKLSEVVQYRKFSGIIPAKDGCTHRKTQAHHVEPQSKLKMHRFYDRISHFIPDNAIAIADTGTSMFSVAETMLPKNSLFVGQIYYGSIGFSVGCALGCALAAPDRKILLFVGDGSFQMTCQELASFIRYNCNIVVFLINNDGYTIERLIHDGSFNDIQSWKYHQLMEVFGANHKGYDLRTEEDLETALSKIQHSNQTEFLELHFDRMDCSDGLKKTGKAMAENLKKMQQISSTSFM